MTEPQQNKMCFGCVIHTVCYRQGLSYRPPCASHGSTTSAEQVLKKIETRLISEATKAKSWNNKTLGIVALINEMEVAAKEIAELLSERERG